MSYKRIASIATVATAPFTVLAAWTAAAAAAGPAAFFEQSSIVGAGETITVSRVPVQDSTGKITYKDVTIDFVVSPTGALSGDLPVITPSPTFVVSRFKAGSYAFPGTGSIAVTGPGVGGPGGQTAWTLAAQSSGCTNPPSATWYTGPIASNPLHARLQKAGIAQTQYSYGIIGSGPSCSGFWANGGLFGAQQVGNTLTLVSFTSAGSDSAIPLTQVTFTLAQ